MGAEKEGCIFEGTGQAGTEPETFTIWLTDATEKECDEWKRTAEGVESVTKRPRGVPACDLQVEGVRVRVYGGNVAEFVCAAL